jgi:hypothetical protein
MEKTFICNVESAAFSCQNSKGLIRRETKEMKMKLDSRLNNSNCLLNAKAIYSTYSQNDD